MLGRTWIIAIPLYFYVAGTEVKASPLPTLQDPAFHGATTPKSSIATTSDRVGKRQSKDKLSEASGIKPMSRIANRIQNRIESRISSRIDGYRGPNSTTTSSFKIADDQVRNIQR